MLTAVLLSRKNTNRKLFCLLLFTFPVIDYNRCMHGLFQLIGDDPKLLTDSSSVHWTPEYVETQLSDSWRGVNRAANNFFFLKGHVSA